MITSKLKNAWKEYYEIEFYARSEKGIPISDRVKENIDSQIKNMFIRDVYELTQNINPTKGERIVLFLFTFFILLILFSGVYVINFYSIFWGLSLAIFPNFVITSFLFCMFT